MKGQAVDDMAAVCRSFDFTWTPLCVYIWLTIFITQFQLVPDLMECKCCISHGVSIYSWPYVYRVLTYTKFNLCQSLWNVTIVYVWECLYSWPLKTGPIYFPETVVRNYHYFGVIPQNSAFLCTNMLFGRHLGAQNFHYTWSLSQVLSFIFISFQRSEVTTRC